LEVILRKRFRLTADLVVDVGETVGKNVKRRALIGALLKAFLADDEAILRHYRMWLMDELSTGILAESVLKHFTKETDEEILLPVLARCCARVRKHFETALEKEKAQSGSEFYSDLEELFGHFGLFEVEKAEFEMVGEGKENG
jgi:hypothetical protein